MSDKSAEREVEAEVSEGAKRRRKRSCSLNQQDPLPGSEAMQAAASNDLILKCIFKHLRTTDLIIGCRLVNKQWDRVATETLKKRSDAYIKVDSKTDFKALKSCIKSSFDFPFREIDLKCRREDFKNSPEQWLQLKLFRRHGDLFNRLRLSSVKNIPDKVLVGLLSGPFKNIQSLTLGRVIRDKQTPKIGLDAGDDKDDEELFSLEQLRTLKFIQNHETYILRDEVDTAFLNWLWYRCGPKLEEICDISYTYLPGVDAVGKLGAVKSLLVCVCLAKQNQGMNPYPYPALPGVSSVSTYNCDRYKDGEEPVGPFLLQLLDSCKETLKKLEFYWSLNPNCFLNYLDLEANQMDYLHLLRYYALEGWRKQGPYFTSAFPSLKTIRVGRYSEFDEFELTARSLGMEPIPSVNTLELCAYIAPGEWEGLSHTLPNVRTVRIDFERSQDYETEEAKRSYEDENWRWDPDLPPVLEPESMPYLDPFLCHHFATLEKLEIYNIPILEVNLDALLTGFSRRLVKDLRGQPPFAVPPGFLAIMTQREGSLMFFKGLKELVMSFTMPDETKPYDIGMYHPVISEVAVDYGFKLIPEMNVTFLYDFRCKNAKLIRKALKPVAQFVKFEHRDAKEHF